MGDRFQNEKSGGSSTKKKMAFKVHHSEKTLTTVPLLTENPAVGLAQRIIDLDFSTDLCQHLARLRKKYIDEGLGPLTKVDFDEWALRPENSWQSARPDVVVSSRVKASIMINEIRRLRGEKKSCSYETQLPEVAKASNGSSFGLQERKIGDLGSCSRNVIQNSDYIEGVPVVDGDFDFHVAAKAQGMSKHLKMWAAARSIEPSDFMLYRKFHAYDVFANIRGLWNFKIGSVVGSLLPDCGSYGLHVRTVNDLHTTVGFCHKKDGDIYHFKSDKAGLRCHLRNGTSYDVEATGPLAKQAKYDFLVEVGDDWSCVLSVGQEVLSKFIRTADITISQLRFNASYEVDDPT